MGVYKPGGWVTGPSRFPQEEPVRINEGVLPEANPTANDRKRGPYHALSGKWVDSKVKKRKSEQFCLRQTAYIGNVPKAGFQLVFSSFRG